MVLISDGKTEHVSYALRKIGLFGKKIRFFTALDLTNCLKQIKLQRLLLTFAPNAALPNNKRTMTSLERKYYG